MTKPITAVATMILVEESKLHLDEPVDRLLPELAKRKVLKRVDGPLDDTIPAKRPITVRDLLTFQLGLVFLLAPPDSHPIVKAMYEQQVGVTPFPAQMPHPPDEWMRRLGTLPLMYQPGRAATDGPHDFGRKHGLGIWCIGADQTRWPRNACRPLRMERRARLLVVERSKRALDRDHCDRAHV